MGNQRVLKSLKVFYLHNSPNNSKSEWMPEIVSKIVIINKFL